MITLLHLSSVQKELTIQMYLLVDHSDIGDMLNIPSLHSRGQNNITDSIKR